MYFPRSTRLEGLGGRCCPKLNPPLIKVQTTAATAKLDRDHLDCEPLACAGFRLSKPSPAKSQSSGRSARLRLPQKSGQDSVVLGYTGGTLRRRSRIPTLRVSENQ